MKCIVYVSEAPLTKNGIRLPVGLSGIVKASNRNNNSDITGFLCYRQGCYFQIIEGPETQINQLALKISIDSRHENFQVLINKPILQRSFSEWKVNVFNFIDKNDLFEQFIESYKLEIADMTGQQKMHLGYFHDLAAVTHPEQTAPNSEQSYEGKDLRLIAWPDFNLISQSQIAVNLCIKITKQPYPFNQLIAGYDFEEYEQTIEIIKKIDALGILKVTESKSPKALTQPKKQTQEPVIQTKKPSSFYGAIKKFLGMR